MERVRDHLPPELAQPFSDGDVPGVSARLLRWYESGFARPDQKDLTLLDRPDFAPDEFLVLLTDPFHNFTGALATLTDLPATTDAWQIILDKLIVHASIAERDRSIDGLYLVTYWHEHGDEHTTGLLITRYSDSIYPHILDLPAFPAQTLGLLAVSSDDTRTRTAVLAISATTSATGDITHPTDRVLLSSANGRTLATMPISANERHAGHAIASFLLDHLDTNIDRNRNNRIA